MRRFGLVAAGLLTVAMTAAGGVAVASPGTTPPPVSGFLPTPPSLPAHGERPVCGPPAPWAAACHAHVVTLPDSAEPLATKTYTDGLTPLQLQDAYALSAATGAPGSGPIVAVVDAYDNPNAEADLNKYRDQFGLGPCTSATGCFAKVNQNGGTRLPRGNVNWGGEIDLDIQMVSAVCPSCKILLVEASSNRFSDLMKAVDWAAAHASFVSNSYGAAEFSGETSYDVHFNQPGVAFTVSSGDAGFGVQYPAASPFVTAVGGTSLTADPSVTRGWTETAWSGAGSGCSIVEAKPSWQVDTGCPDGRTVADVSAVADPDTGVAVYDSYGSKRGANWYVYGGTSVAAPLIAGMWASAGVVPAATPATTLYANSSAWNDVLSGSNGTCGSYLCTASDGYDGPTGLGTPHGLAGFVPAS